MVHSDHVRQAIVTSQSKLRFNQYAEKLALFNSDGSPFSGGSGSGGGPTGSIPVYVFASTDEMNNSELISSVGTGTFKGEAFILVQNYPTPSGATYTAMYLIYNDGQGIYTFTPDPNLTTLYGSVVTINIPSASVTNVQDALSDIYSKLSYLTFAPDGLKASSVRLSLATSNGSVDVDAAIQNLDSRLSALENPA